MKTETDIETINGQLDAEAAAEREAADAAADAWEENQRNQRKAYEEADAKVMAAFKACETHATGDINALIEANWPKELIEENRQLATA